LSVKVYKMSWFLFDTIPSCGHSVTTFNTGMTVDINVLCNYKLAVRITEEV